ncbi:hypothetical protein BJX62DRAFT_138703 [Aspergillus germanicus]
MSFCLPKLRSSPLDLPVIRVLSLVRSFPLLSPLFFSSSLCTFSLVLCPSPNLAAPPPSVSSPPLPPFPWVSQPAYLGLLSLPKFVLIAFLIFQNFFFTRKKRIEKIISFETTSHFFFPSHPPFPLPLLDLRTYTRLSLARFAPSNKLS